MIFPHTKKQMIMQLQADYASQDGRIFLTMCAASRVTVFPLFTLGSVTGTFILQEIYTHICNTIILEYNQTGYQNVASN